MSNPKVAVQMFTLRERLQTDGVFNTLKRLHDLGYSAVEISAVEMSDENIKEMERAINELGMDICALSVVTQSSMPGRNDEALKDDFDRIVDYTKRLDCQYLRIGMLPFQYLGQEDKFLEFAEEMDSYGARLKEHGIKLFYHNHHFEFEKFGGKLALDILVENTDPSHVGFELDTHWIQRGGQNPVDWIKRLKGRVELVHLKDYRIATPKEFTGPEAMLKMVQFAEVGEGTLDFVQIINTCRESDVRYLPIEQDMTYGRDPYDSLKISMDNIKKMGVSVEF